MNELKIPTNLECSSIETISLNEQTNYRLMEIGKIKYYFDQEIKYQQLLTSKLSKYLTGFDYADKILTIFLTVFSGTNIFANVKEEKQLLGLITSVFLLFCLSSDVLKNYNKKQKQERKNTTNYCIWLKTNLIVLKC